MTPVSRFRVAIETPDGPVYVEVWAASAEAAKAFGDRIAWADPVTQARTPIACREEVNRTR